MENMIRLSHYAHASRFAGGVKTEVNGVELQEVVNIDLHCPVDGLPVLRVEQLGTGELNVTLNGIVEPVVIMMPDPAFELVVDHPEPGKTRYRVVRKEA